jgi:hypothetical protein
MAPDMPAGVVQVASSDKPDGPIVTVVGTVPNGLPPFDYPWRVLPSNCNVRRKFEGREILIISLQVIVADDQFIVLKVLRKYHELLVDHPDADV